MIFAGRSESSGFRPRAAGAAAAADGPYLRGLRSATVGPSAAASHGEPGGGCRHRHDLGADDVPGHCLSARGTCSIAGGHGFRVGGNFRRAESKLAASGSGLAAAAFIT
jgi:hypothetical protein